MKWILFYVLLSTNNIKTGEMEFNNIDDCLTAKREMIAELYPKDRQAGFSPLLAVDAECFMKKPVE